MAPGERSDDPFYLAAAIARVRSALRTQFEAQAAPYEVTASQFHVLRRLWREDGLNTCALMRSAGSDGGTITGVVDRLEAKGLVRRVRDASDRRAVHVFLTPEGRALEAPLAAVALDVIRASLRGIGTAEQAALLAGLEAMERNLCQAPPDGAAARAGAHHAA